MKGTFSGFKYKSFLIKILAALASPIAILFYLPDFSADFYYIGNFDAVWKYPFKKKEYSLFNNPEFSTRHHNTGYLMKDTNASLHSPDYISEKEYQNLPNQLIIRWKNLAYKKSKSEIYPIHDTSKNKQNLFPDTLREIEFLIPDAQINPELPNSDGEYRTTGLTRSDRDVINRAIYHYFKKNSSFTYRATVYCFAFFLLLIFLTYLRNFQPELYTDEKKIVFIYFLMGVAISGFMLFHKWNLMLQAYPLLMFPLIALVFFNPHLSGLFYWAQSLILMWFFPDKIEFMAVFVPSGLFCIYAYKLFDNRKKLSFLGLFYFMLSSFFYVLYHIITGDTTSLKYYSSYFPFALGGGSLFLTPGFIYLAERIFGMVSDFRLMELTDLRHPLLRQLSEQVPGTFHHTIQVSAMAEEGAYHLNANTLLVRVGALYHDIGKIYHPEFFIENRNEDELFKNDIPPEKAAEIIISHVKDGIELAYAHGLPEQVIDFIRTHHGTTRVEYFFKEYQKNHPDVDEKKFRYPGPLPFNKETAIVMLADSVEAASRSLKNPDEVSIHEMVDRVFDYKINDHQLIYSDLTFKDIQVLKKLFKKRLLKIYHKRAV